MQQYIEHVLYGLKYWFDDLFDGMFLNDLHVLSLFQLHFHVVCFVLYYLIFLNHFYFLILISMSVFILKTHYVRTNENNKLFETETEILEVNYIDLKV